MVSYSRDLTPQIQLNLKVLKLCSIYLNAYSHMSWMSCSRNFVRGVDVERELNSACAPRSYLGP